MAAGRVPLVAAPAVVHAHPTEVGQDADGVRRRVPALRMAGVVGEAAGARHVRPRHPPGAAHAGLVVVQHPSARERRLDVPLHRLERPRRPRDPAHQRAVRLAHAPQVGEQLLRAAGAAGVAARPGRRLRACVGIEGAIA